MVVVCIRSISIFYSPAPASQTLFFSWILEYRPSPLPRCGASIPRFKVGTFLHQPHCTAASDPPVILYCPFHHLGHRALTPLHQAEHRTLAQHLIRLSHSLRFPFLPASPQHFSPSQVTHSSVSSCRLFLCPLPISYPTVTPHLSPSIRRTRLLLSPRSLALFLGLFHHQTTLLAPSLSSQSLCCTICPSAFLTLLDIGHILASKS